MQWWQAIVLGLVEGVTEFLPISSTGHLILTSSLLGIVESEFVKSFEIIIQLGAILAVVALYLKRVWENREWWGRVIVAFVPTGILGVLLYKIVKAYFLGNDMLVVVALMVGGVAILVIERWLAGRQEEGAEITEMSYPRMASVGLAQALSMIPGVSRAAASIFGGIAVGMKREAAVEFSFLLAVPTMIAATGLDLLKMETGFTKPEMQLLAVGFLVAFMTAGVVVKALLKYVQKHNFTIFGWYRIGVALLYLWIVR